MVTVKHRVQVPYEQGKKYEIIIITNNEMKCIDGLDINTNTAYKKYDTVWHRFNIIYALHGASPPPEHLAEENASCLGLNKEMKWKESLLEENPQCHVWKAAHEIRRHTTELQREGGVSTDYSILHCTPSHRTYDFHVSVCNFT